MSTSHHNPGEPESDATGMRPAPVAVPPTGDSPAGSDVPPGDEKPAARAPFWQWRLSVRASIGVCGAIVLAAALAMITLNDGLVVNIRIGSNPEAAATALPLS